MPATSRSGRAAQIRTTLRRVGNSSIARGSAVNFIGLLSYMVLQLVSVPVLSRAFGLDGYGTWVLLWTVPAYLGLADLGLVNAAANEIAARWGRGDSAGMRTTFQSISSVSSALALAIAALTTLFVVATSGIDGFWSADLAPVRPTVVALGCWAGLLLMSQAPASVLRSTGHYARGTLFYDGASTLDSIALLATAAWTRDMNSSAVAMAFTRLASTMVLTWQMHRHSGLRLGLRHASLGEVRRLLPSALGSLAIPAVLALSLQGSTLMIGWAFGPVAVALIVPARTLSRLANQFIGLINRATIPNIAAAHGRGDAAAQLRLWRWNRRITALILGTGAILFALLGKQVVLLWTGGLIDTPLLYIVILAAGLAANGWWFFGLWLLTATHAHTRRIPHLFAGTLLGLVVGLALLPLAGVAGILLGVLATDLLLILAVESAVRGQLRGLRAAAAAKA